MPTKPAPKPRKAAAVAVAAAPRVSLPALPLPSRAALRTAGIRVGIAAAVIAAGAGLYAWRESRHRPEIVAAAPAPPARPAAPVATPEPPAALAPEPPRREAKADAKPMSPALRAAFDAWLMGSYAKCWRAPKTTPDGDPYLPKVRVAFKEDGGLAGAPKLVNPPSDPAWRPHADAALKAVKGCDPLHVPDKYADYYPSWKSRTVYFDPTRN